MTKNLKSFSLKSNAKLAQIGECQTGMAGVQSPLEVTFLMNDSFFAFPMYTFIPILPTLFNYCKFEKMKLSFILLS